MKKIKKNNETMKANSAKLYAVIAKFDYCSTEFYFSKQPHTASTLLPSQIEAPNVPHHNTNKIPAIFRQPIAVMVSIETVTTQGKSLAIYAILPQKDSSI